jgi:glycerol-3-phosphate acyltransferase PlsY
MTPRAAATIGIRIVALWLWVQALLHVVILLVAFLRSYASSASDLAQRQAAFSYVWPTIGLDLLAAFLLFALSRSIGRFIARRVE